MGIDDGRMVNREEEDIARRDRGRWQSSVRVVAIRGDEEEILDDARSRNDMDVTRPPNAMGGGKVKEGWTEVGAYAVPEARLGSVGCTLGVVRNA